jgi:thiol-disulfide isomerase/thioredoxin
MKQYTSWIVTGLLTFGSLGGIFWYASAPGTLDTFAQCIADKKAVFYGASWCSHCKEQKALFGKSARLLPYEECSTPDMNGQNQICKDKKIESYPTWDFVKDGVTTRKSEVMSLTDLSSITGCPITQVSK